MVPLSQSVTYRSEGSYDSTSPFFVLAPHQPTMSSGVTVGLGYDLGFKKSAQVSRIFRLAGIPGDVTRRYLPAVGLRGLAARSFLTQNALPHLTVGQSDRLFALAYAEAAADVQRICLKEDVTRIYGRTNWSTLDLRIKELLIDLRYRGDYTTLTRRFIQRAVALNDVSSLARIMQNRTLWANVPYARFLSRQEIFSSARGRLFQPIG